MLKFPFGKTHFRGRPKKGGRILREKLDFDPLFQELMQNWIILLICKFLTPSIVETVLRKDFGSMSADVSYN